MMGWGLKGYKHRLEGLLVMVRFGQGCHWRWFGQENGMKWTSYCALAQNKLSF